MGIQKNTGFFNEKNGRAKKQRAPDGRNKNSQKITLQPKKTAKKSAHRKEIGEKKGK